jgi:hypothetical protein
MPKVRKENINHFSKEELLQLVKDHLDQLGIAYEGKPGGFGPGPLLDPQVFDLVDYSEYTIKKAPFHRSTYQPGNHVNFSYAAFSSDIFGDDDYLYLAS